MASILGSMPSVAEHPFPIVGVGASAGGLSALTILLAALPPRPGIALVVIQHLDPKHESHLNQVLTPHTSMTVVDAGHGAKVAPDHVYVIQPNTSVAIADGVLTVTPRPDDRRPHYPVDHFLRSLAAVQGPSAVGVILSGTGSDGTLGVCEIKAAGGLTFAQDEQSAQHAGMPHSAIASGAVDLVLPPEEIAERLAAVRDHPFLSGAEDDSDARENPEPFQRVIVALRNSSGVDFSQYRDTTIKRRTARRMMLRGFTSTLEYAQFLERDREESEALYRDVLINVTSFFRDPQMFEDLKRQVFPTIVNGKSDGLPIRVWVPGCSTGQEAYSIAMALLESLDTAKTKRAIQIFATDLGDPRFLDRAPRGLLSGEHRGRTQPRTCPTVLRQGGSPLPDYEGGTGSVRVRAAECHGRSTVLAGRSGDLSERADLHVAAAARTAVAGVSLRAESRRLSRPGLGGDDRFVRRSVRTHEPREIQQFRGRTSPYFETPSGQPTTNILRLAKQGLFMELRSALTEAKATNGPIVREGLHVADGSDDIEFTLRVLPVILPHQADCCLLVLFESKDWPAWSAAALTQDDGLTTHANRDAAWLREELASTKQYLQSIVDDQEAASQELRAAHEEVLSSNEELQSTNEELETAKEELQASNEELTTVNEQFQSRNRELDVLTDDLANFISSADVAMVTVGRDLRVRRLTPAARRAFNLLPSDVGRSLEHINSALTIDGIAAVIETVIATVQPWEREVRDREGRWWVVRVQPFRTGDNRIDGATLVAMDVHLLRQSHEFMEARDAALAIVQAVREPLVVLDADCRVGLANDAFYALLDETAEQIVDKPIWEGGHGVWTLGNLPQALQDVCCGKHRLINLEITRVLRGRDRTLVLNTRTITRAERPSLILLAVDDITDARQSEALRVDAETLRLVDKRKDEFLGILAHELRNPLAPMRFALELLKRSDGSPTETLRVRQVLDRQVTHMVRIVDDLLDVSRITQGKVELRKERLTLADIVHAAVELARPGVNAAGHMLTVSLPDETVTLDADAVRLTQVLVNLLNNATKFTPPGGHIWLIAETVGDQGGSPNQLRMRVRDTGIGIGPALLPKIFDMFMQGDQSLERSRAGLGVGLTLVRRLVALHGGAVDVYSDGEGAGSEFTVSLPIDPLAQSVAVAEEAPADASAVAPLRILVAEDNDDGREMLVYFLTAEGHTVVQASDGPMAIAMAATFQPHVAILDIGMPGMSGYTVAQRLREGLQASSLVLVALSGLGQQEDKARAAQAGFDRHFTKPVDVNALRAFLTKAGQDITE